MNPGLLVAYLGLVGLLTLTPGPDTALVVRNAARRGWRAGLLTALGCASGLQVWAVASALGISVLVAASEIGFQVLRVAGAAYLALLGLMMLRQALWPAATGGDGGPGLPREGLLRLPPFHQGLVNNLLNPKALAFFTALLPQFIPPHGSVAGFTLLLGLIAGCASLSGLTAFGLLASGARRLLQRPPVQRVVDGVGGAAMIGLAARLALARR